MPVRLVTKRQEIAAIAGAVLSGSIDPLTACRRMLLLAGEAEREDPDFLTIVGIDSETDHLPAPEQRHLWDPDALVKKDLQIEEYFKHAGPRLRQACVHIAAKWRSA
jgi:hypothetical protein